MSSGGDRLRMCGVDGFFRDAGGTSSTQERAAGVDLVHQVVALHAGVQRAGERMALALLTQMSMPPNFSTVCVDGRLDLLLVADVHDQASALPPASSISSAAV